MEARDSGQRHVLVLNHFAKPRNASGGTRHVDLFGRLAGWDARILASNRSYFSPGARDPSDALVTVVWTTPYAGAGIRRILNWLSYAVTAIVAGLRGARPDVVYGSTPHLLAPFAAWVLARRYRVPFVLEVRDLWPQVLVEMDRLRPDSLLCRFLSRLEAWLYDHADAIVVLADGVREELTRRGVAAEKVLTIPNGADPVDFHVGADRDELRKRFEFDGVVFVYAGAHGPANGLGLVLDAAAAVREDHPDAHFVFVGDGPSKAELLTAAQRRGLDRVRFLDPVAKSAMPEFLAAADVGLHVLADVPLFRYGVSPNKVVDYMAAALPVLTNSPGEVGGLVLRAGAGQVVEPDELECGTRALLSITPEERAQLGASGQAHIARVRSPTVLAPRLEALLGSLAEDGRVLS